LAASLVEDAFAHHIWATKKVAEACAELTLEQLTAEVSGTFGSILDTMRHLIGADSFYQTTLTGRGHVLSKHPDTLDVRDMSAAVDELGNEWTRLLAANLDANAVIHEEDEDDGFQRDATVGLRIAQALHHGNDHRTQVCTAFTLLGIEPPDVDVWQFGIETGRSTEVLPPS
jgi:uncharacterized damage-inducible protein DinB